MLLDLVNPFAEASFDIVKGYIPEGINRSDIGLLDKDAILKGIAVRIPIKNLENSAVLLLMEDKVAKNLVTSLIGEEVKEWDDYTSSALGELGNMVSGLAVTKLESVGIDLDINPPELLFYDEGLTEIKLSQEAMEVTLDTNLGRIQVVVYVKELNL